MATPGTEYVSCSDCAAWKEVGGLPDQADHRFCTLRPRVVMLGNSHVNGTPSDRHKLNRGFVSVYPIQHKKDGCFYGVTKG